jgi:hypothetical protein
MCNKMSSFLYGAEKSTNVLRPCSCGLSREQVLDLDRQKIVQLQHGFCQNPRKDTSRGACGMPLGAHHSNGNCFLKSYSKYLCPTTSCLPVLFVCFSLTLCDFG